MAQLPPGFVSASFFARLEMCSTGYLGPTLNSRHYGGFQDTKMNFETVG